MKRYNGPPSPFLVPEYIIILIKEQILLDVMLKILPYEIQQLSKAGLKMAHVYTAPMHEAIDTLLKKQTMNKRALEQGGCKIVSMETSKGKVVAHYLHNGYEYEMMLLEDMLKAETEISMAYILGVDLTEIDRDAE